MIKIANNLMSLLVNKQAAAAEAAPTNPNAGFPGVPATTSFYEQLAARGVGPRHHGAEAATEAIDSARAYQRDHPTDLPGSISPFIPTYSTEDVNRQFPIVIKEKAKGDPSNHAAYYRSNEDAVTVRPNYASNLATGPTVAKKYLPSLGTHELTHAITPHANAYRRHRVEAPWYLGHPTSYASAWFPTSEMKQERALIAAVGAIDAAVPKDTPHDLHPAEIATEISDEKYDYSQITGRSTIMTTPEEQKAFRDWSYSAANPSAVKQTDGSYAPASHSVWGQLNKLTPEQQSYLMGSIVKGQTPQQPAYGNYPTATPYSQYQA